MESESIKSEMNGTNGSTTHSINTQNKRNQYRSIHDDKNRRLDNQLSLLAVKLIYFSYMDPAKTPTIFKQTINYNRSKHYQLHLPINTEVNLLFVAIEDIGHQLYHILVAKVSSLHLKHTHLTQYFAFVR